jgi:heme/copper-type cytochrome/quinol oxidase subunit 1
MKNILLIIRLLVEAMVGLICTGLLLLPEVWRGKFPVQSILGFLGMPHRYHALADFQRVNIMTPGGLLAVTIVLLIGTLCLKDVLKKRQQLKRV